jgi:PAS domain S-box-containing protein
MNYKTKVGVAYILGLCVMCAVGFLSYNDSRLEARTEERVVHSHDILEAVQVVTGEFASAGAARLAFALTGDHAFADAFEASAGRTEKAVGTLHDLTADNPRQQKRVDELRSILRQSFGATREQIQSGALRSADLDQQQKWAEQSRAASDKIQGVASHIRSEELALLAGRARAALASSRLVGWTTPLGYSLGGIFMVVAFLFLRSEILRRECAQEELISAQAQLERRVEERTRDLAEANRQLQRSQDRMAMAQSIARIGTYDLDVETGRATWTSGMEALYGLPPGGFDGNIDTWRSLVHPDDLENTNRHYQQLIGEHNSLELEFRIVRPDGQVRWLAACGRLFRDATGKLTRLVGVNVDITDQKLRETEAALLNATLELRVEERTTELVRANQELEAFSYSVSHDLRAPLRHIDGFARILLEDHAEELSAEGRHHLDRILASVNHMGHLVDDLINLARIGRKEMTKQRVNLEEVVRQALSDLPQEEEKREIEWRIEPLPEVEGDPGLLKLVFHNLLSNAAKFTRTRQPAVIEVGTSGPREAPVIFIRDNGVGFDPQYADKLFGVFQRLHRQEDFEGTGIGLATVQRIIRRHGGEIRTEAAVDRGATFFLTLKPAPNSNAPGGATEEKVGRSHEH